MSRSPESPFSISILHEGSKPSSSRRPVAAEDLYRIQLISGCELSPDGQHVAFALHRVDVRTEKKYANIWIATTSRGVAQQFTVGDQTDQQPKWSPDGTRIAFLSNRKDEKQAQIHVIPFGGGEAVPKTDFKGRILSFQWSADSTRFVCAVRKTDAEVLEREEDEKKKKLGIVARRMTRVQYKLDGQGFLPEERSHLWTVDAETGEARQLTDGDAYGESDPSWSPDGETILFCSNRSEDLDFRPGALDFYLMPDTCEDFDESSWRKVETFYGPKGDPTFSPDGQWIAFTGIEGEGESWRNTDLWVVAADGSTPARNLTASKDFFIGNATSSDVFNGVTMPPVWSSDSRRIYVQISHQGNTTLHSVFLMEEEPSFQPVIDRTGAIGAFSMDTAQTRLAYLHSDWSNPGQIRVFSLEDGIDKAITLVNQDLLAEMNLGNIEEVWYKGKDDNDLQGWIVRPPGFDETKSYPAIVEIHGGPLAQYGNVFFHEFHFLASQGYLVCLSNPRGGRGYGEVHAHGSWNDVGGSDYDDLMSWTDHVERLPYVDSERMGVAGGSYGGLMVNFIIARSQRFRAAVSQRTVMERISVYASDMNWRRNYMFGGVYPWEDFEPYWRQSPLREIGNVKTPTLILHSENDLRCPIYQGEQLFVALKVLGVETEMVRFPDESHGLSRGGRTDRRVARLEHILRWFDQYLKPAT